MIVTPIKSEIFKNGDDILSHFLATSTALSNGDILVISSKIVALWQKRQVRLSDIHSHPEEALKQLITNEADVLYNGRYMLALKNNILIPFAGIDISNVPYGYAVLWPEDPFLVAKQLHEILLEHFHLQELGVLIIDSQCHPLRLGVIGLALGWHGFVGVEDERGRSDIYGKPLKVTRKAVADNLASSAMLTQGEADECTPYARIENAPVKFCEYSQKNNSVWNDLEEDVFFSVLKL